MEATSVFTILALLVTVGAAIDEPTCSKFAYEASTLERMIRTEVKCETILQDAVAVKESMLGEMRELKKQTTDILQDVRTALGDMASEKEKVANEMRTVLRDIASEKEKMTKEIQTAILGLKPIVVAFKAKMTSNVNLKHRDTLVFPDVIDNLGNGYNAASGTFTAPVGGVYLITLQLCMSAGHSIVVETMVDDKKVSHAYFYDGSYSICYDHTDLITLDSGSRLSFRSGSSSRSTVTLYADSTIKSNYIAGVLVSIQ